MPVCSAEHAYECGRTPLRPHSFLSTVAAVDLLSFLVSFSCTIRHVTLHCRWVVQSVGGAQAGAALAGQDSLLSAPSSSPRFLWARALHAVLQLYAAFFACSKDVKDAGVLPPVTILALFNQCPVLVFINYSIHSESTV